MKNSLLTATAVSSLLLAERDEHFREAPVIVAWLILLILPLATTTIALFGWWWWAITFLPRKDQAEQLLPASGICGMALFFGGKGISGIYGMDGCILMSAGLKDWVLEVAVVGWMSCHS